MAVILKHIRENIEYFNNFITSKKEQISWLNHRKRTHIAKQKAYIFHFMMTKYFIIQWLYNF